MSCNLLSEESFSVVDIESIKVIRITIPRADRHQKPVYLSDKVFGETYIRRNEGDCKADKETVKRLLAEQVEDSRDEKFLSGFTIKDFDISTISAYRNRFSAVKVGHSWIDLPLEEFLVKIGALGIDRSSGEIKVRLAGLLMFGKSESIVDELPNFMLDYQERPEAKTERRWVDRVAVDGTWSGNIYDFFRKVYPKLVKDLQVPFSVNEGQRQDDTPVHVALREALVNSLIHADYSGRMSILIVKRPDLFGFRNPGLMRVSLELALAGGNSDCRNRRLQTMFQLVGYGEKAGSGIPNIVHGWKLQQWQQPVFEQVDNPEQTLIKLTMHSLLPDNVMQTLHQKLGDHFQSLSELEKLTVATAYIELRVSNNRIQTMCDNHSSDITKMLTKLVTDNIFRAYGKSRGRIYYLPWLSIYKDQNDEFEFKLPSNENLQLIDDTLNNESIHKSLGIIKKNENLSTTLELTPELMTKEMPIFVEEQQIPQNVLEYFYDLTAHIRASKRSQKDDMEKIIESLCLDCYLSIKVIAILLKRDADNIRKTGNTPIFN